MKRFDPTSSERCGRTGPRWVRQVACALLLGLPIVAQAGSADEPLVLTMDDLARIAGKKAPSTPAGPGSATPSGKAGLILVSEPTPAAAPEEASERVAPSWREEYYRLKAIALKRAMENGESVSFADDPAPAASPSDPPAAPLARNNGEPACVYDRDGLLIHAPPGAGCLAHRDERLPEAQADVCMYGIAGEVLHGRDCD